MAIVTVRLYNHNAQSAQAKTVTIKSTNNSQTFNMQTDTGNSGFIYTDNNTNYISAEATCQSGYKCTGWQYSLVNNDNGAYVEAETTNASSFSLSGLLLGLSSCTLHLWPYINKISSSGGSGTGTTLPTSPPYYFVPKIGDTYFNTAEIQYNYNYFDFLYGSTYTEWCQTYGPHPNYAWKQDSYNSQIYYLLFEGHTINYIDPYTNTSITQTQMVSPFTVAATNELNINTPSQKRFKEWNSSINGDGQSFQPGESCNANEYSTLFIIWEDANRTLTYNANGGTGGPDDQTLAPGSSITIDFSNLPTHTDEYFCKGWDTNQNAIIPTYRPNGETKLTLNQDITLFAIWWPKFNWTSNYRKAEANILITYINQYIQPSTPLTLMSETEDVIFDDEVYNAIVKALGNQINKVNENETYVEASQLIALKDGYINY